MTVMAKKILDENQILPISLRVLIITTVAIVTSIIYVITNNLQISNRIDGSNIRISNLEDRQGKQEDQLSYLKILMIRMADKLGVDTSDPNKKSPLQGYSSDIFLPL